MEGKLTRKRAKLAHFHATQIHVDSLMHSYILAVKKKSMWAKFCTGPLISIHVINKLLIINITSTKRDHSAYLSQK